VGFAPVFGSDAFPAGLGSEPSGLGDPVLEAFTIPVFLELSSSIPSQVSAPESFLEKSSTPLEGAATTLFSFASGGFAGPAIKTGSLSVGSRLVSVGASTSASSVVLSGAALGLGAAWKSASASQHDQFALLDLAPYLALDGLGPAFLDVPGNCSSGVDALGERLRYSLPVMSESGAPIYPSKSKSVLRYSRNHKIGKLVEHMLAEVLEAFSAPKAPSLPCFGVAAKPLSALVRDGIVSTPG
jgi:hypothetical protein